jgi:hypothetical protein
MGYEANKPCFSNREQGFVLFYPVRNLVSNGVNPDFLSISLGTMRKRAEEIEIAMHMSQE